MCVKPVFPEVWISVCKNVLRWPVSYMVCDAVSNAQVTLCTVRKGTVLGELCGRAYTNINTYVIYKHKRQ